MRKLILCLPLVVLTACKTGDPLAEGGAGGPQWGVIGEVKFTRDSRPVDGPLVEIILTRTARGYDANKHVLTSGFGSPVQETTELLANDLTCENIGRDGVLTSIRCLVDTRPVDGPVIEINFAVQTSGRYNGRMLLTPSGFGGDPTPRLTEFGEGFELVVTN
jgi:hypothetical protein